MKSENHHQIVGVRKLDESKPHTRLAWDTITSKLEKTNTLHHDQEAPQNPPKGAQPFLMTPKFSHSLFDIIITKKIRLDDITSRTYFNQIIANLEVIHSQGTAYRNLNLSSLFLDESLTLKLSSNLNQRVCWKEDLGCQAPEVLEGVCGNPQKSDIYSLGVILFLFKTGGYLPYDADGLFEGVDMRGLLRKNQNKFWQMQCKRLNKKAAFFSFDFRKLFMKMTEVDPRNRPGLEEIKYSVWCTKKTHSTEELFAAMMTRREEDRDVFE